MSSQKKPGMLGENPGNPVSEFWVCEVCGMMEATRPGVKPEDVPCRRCGRPLGVIV